MYAELFLAGCAAIVWCRTDTGLLHQHAQNVMITASVVTLLFNANPLMRFDGYYMLSDWLELPNLATHGAQWLRNLGRQYVLGMALQHPSWPEGKTAWIIAYGFAALAFRILITVSLIIAAEAMLLGAGLVLALAAVLFWFVIPGWQLLYSVMLATGPQPPCRRRIAIVTGTAGLILWFSWTFLPWYSRVSAPAIVDYYPVTEIRSPVGGFVSRVLIATGDDVSAGQLLVSLQNEELRLEAESLRVEIEQSAQRARKFRHDHEIAAFQVEIKSREALAARLQQFDSELANLEIRAPLAGRIIRSELQDRMGTYVPAGAHIMSIGGDKSKRIQALVPQKYLEPFRSHMGQPVSLHIWGFGKRSLVAKLEQVHPRASSALIHPALSSMAGGPLPVKVKSPELGESEHGDGAWQWTEPYFPAVIRCQLAWSQFLRPGQTGLVQFRCYRGTFGHVLSENFGRWLRDRQEQARRMR
jgi:putative peptide zinc metalloprotease protein